MINPLYFSGSFDINVTNWVFWSGLINEATTINSIFSSTYTCKPPLEFRNSGSIKATLSPTLGLGFSLKTISASSTANEDVVSWRLIS